MKKTILGAIIARYKKPTPIWARVSEILVGSAAAAGIFYGVELTGDRVIDIAIILGVVIITLATGEVAVDESA